MIWLLQGVLYCSEEGVVTKRMLNKWLQDPMHCHKINECMDYFSSMDSQLGLPIFRYCYSILSNQCQVPVGFKPLGLPSNSYIPSKTPPDAVYTVETSSTTYNFAYQTRIYNLTTQHEETLQNREDYRFDFNKIDLLMNNPSKDHYDEDEIKDYIEFFETLVKAHFNSWAMVSSVGKNPPVNYFWLDLPFFALGLVAPHWSKERKKELKGFLYTIEMWEKNPNKYTYQD